MNGIRQKQGHTEKENFGFSADNKTMDKVDNKAMTNGHAEPIGWFKDVVELRKKAGEYKVRTIIY